MKTKTLTKIIGYGIAIVVAIGFSFLFNWVVMLVWNWLAPKFFGWPELSFWETYGSLFLFSFIVGIFRLKKK